MSKHNIVPSEFPDNSTPKRVYYFCVPDLPPWRELFIGHMMGATYGYFWDKSTGDYDEARGIMSNIVFNGISDSSGDCLCDTIADCILNSTAVQNALDQRASNDTTGNNSQDLASGIDTNNCNSDNIFGATFELVNELNAYANDAFEIIEASTNFVELISEFLGAIPVAGDVLALIPNLLNFFQEVGAETYNASYTNTLRDEIACDLFCIYQENCTLSLDQVFDYLWSEFSASTQPQTINEAINAFVAIGVVIGRITVFGVFMIALAFIKLGDGNLPSIPFVALPSTNRLRIALAVGATQPNNAWTVLCDCGSEPSCQPESNSWNVAEPDTNGWEGRWKNPLATNPPEYGFPLEPSDNVMTITSGLGFVIPDSGVPVKYYGGVTKVYPDTIAPSAIVAKAHNNTNNTTALKIRIKTVANPNWTEVVSQSFSGTSGFKSATYNPTEVDITDIQIAFSGSSTVMRITGVDIIC